MTPEANAANEAARNILIAKRDREQDALAKDEEAIAEAQRRKEGRELKIRILNETIAEMAPQNGNTLPLAGMGKYATMTTREGILDVLRQTGSEFVPASVIAKRLLAEGAQSKSPNFPTIVLTEAKRLQEKFGALERGEGGFRLRVLPLTPPPPTGRTGISFAA